VLDLACGTGLVAFAAAQAVGACGRVLGIDLSGRMVDIAERRAEALQTPNARFERMDAERLALPDASFDVALCAFGLMYLRDPAQAVREWRRVLRPGGRIGLAVWGERVRCAWSEVFAIVDAEVVGEVCPMFFRLGHEDALPRLAGQAGFERVEQQRVATTLSYASADEACSAVFVGGPVALAWSRFPAEVRRRVCARYLESIAPWRDGRAGYHVPAEFVVVSGAAPR